MEAKDFKKLFTEIAKKNGLVNEINALFKESDFALIALILRKSSYSKLFYLRIKVKLKTPGELFQEKKEWVKHDVSDILLGAEAKFNALFDLENQISDSERLNGLEDLFNTNLNELIKKTLDRDGLIELYKSGKLILQPAAKLKLGVN
jgi:hypothetical protein